MKDKTQNDTISSNFQQGEGLTPSERYLRKLCTKTFLSLWSYANVYRDQGMTSTQKTGKEVCDLLVVFDNHIIIFSDKHCEFSKTDDWNLRWNRWFRGAILGNVKQIFGAERWITDYPNRLFLDKFCTQPLPIPMPNISTAKFHYIVVAHGVSKYCKEFFKGGSGSLIIDSNITGSEHNDSSSPNYHPFSIGNVRPDKGYIHVMDDVTLDIIMNTLDTITDFVTYLEKKESFLCKKKVIAFGEEDLLSFYLKNLNKKSEHDFIVSENQEGVIISEGLWKEFIHSPERKTQIEANKVSYAWDKLIETFSKHALEGTQYRAFHQGGIAETEEVLRFMAKESRLGRRMLAQALLGIIKQTQIEDTRNARIIRPTEEGSPYYIFLLLSKPEYASEEEYRLVRGRMLEAYCYVLKLEFPFAKDIIGIATETGINIGRSEDAIYFDARNWNEELRQEAIVLQEKLQILQGDKNFFYGTVLEYPSEYGKFINKKKQDDTFSMKGNNRNTPCPCGSGKKLKKCCGKLF